MIAVALRMRLTARAILSAVRSCRNRPNSGEYVRRGNSTVTLVSSWSLSTRTTNSCAARLKCRSGQLINHNGGSCSKRSARAQLQTAIDSQDKVHRSEFVGLQPVSEAQGLDLREVDRVHEHQNLKARVPGQIEIVGV